MSPEKRFLSAEQCRALFDRLRRMCRGGGELHLFVKSRQMGSVRWARNEIVTAGDVIRHDLYVARYRSAVWGIAMTDQLTDAKLEDAVRRAEQDMYARPPEFRGTTILPMQRYARPELWSDATFGVDADLRAEAQGQLVDPVAAAGLLSAGFLEISAIGHGVINSAGLFAYMPETRAAMSVTVRDTKGTASGWAGKMHRDWTALDAARLVRKAIDKCQRSENAIAIEPGRYTVVLEPQATAELIFPLVKSFDYRFAYYENMSTAPWHRERDKVVRQEGFVGVDAAGFQPHPAGGGITRIGDKVVDSRITLVADPSDPDMPFIPFAPDGSPNRPVTWIDQGILRNLEFSRGDDARLRLHREDSVNNSYAFRIEAGQTSVDDMVASTERGLLVTRLVNVRSAGSDALLQTGNTSDGLWLIEKGKITTPVQNFRFRESPVFALNNLEAVGPAERVFLDPPVIAPALKIRDFSMTSLANAV